MPTSKFLTVKVTHRLFSEPRNEHLSSPNKLHFIYPFLLRFSSRYCYELNRCFDQLYVKQNALRS